MKYVITQKYNSNYVAVDKNGNGYVHRKGSMCYREPKRKWFNTLEEAREFATKVADHPLWERIYSHGIDICEAIINRHVDEYGNRYTTVDEGSEVIDRVPVRESNYSKYGW